MEKRYFLKCLTDFCRRGGGEGEVYVLVVIQ